MQLDSAVYPTKVVKDEPMDCRDAGEDAATPPRATWHAREDDALSESPTPPRRSSPTPQLEESTPAAGEQKSNQASFQPKLKQTGMVVKFDEEKGWGFIRGEGDENYFVHFSGIAGKGFKKLEKGQRVLFDTEWNPDKVKEQATNVQILLNASQQNRKGDRGRSRSPRSKVEMTLLGKKQTCTDDSDPLYAAVNDTLLALFRSEQEHDGNLHKKVMQYVKQAVKRTNFEAHIVDVFKNFADAFFSSLFAAYGDRSWLREVKVDFAWVFDVAVQELFPPELQTKWLEAEIAPDKFRYLLHKAHDKMYDSSRWLSILHESVKNSRVEGKKTQHKVFEACSTGRNAAILSIKKSHGIDVWKSTEERSFSLGDLETFTKYWIQATVQDAKTRATQEGSGPEGILSRTSAVYLFDSLLQERAFPQIMLRSLEDNWPRSPWAHVAKTIQKAYGGEDSHPRRDEPYALAKIADSKNGVQTGGINAKFNAKIQRQRGYGIRRRFASHVKQEDMQSEASPADSLRQRPLQFRNERQEPPPGYFDLPPSGHSASSSSCPVPPPPPARSRPGAPAWAVGSAGTNGYGGSGSGGSGSGLQVYGTEDVPMHSRQVWTEPQQRALPPAPGPAWNSSPPAIAESRIFYGGRERPQLGLRPSVKQEIAQIAQEMGRPHNVKTEYRDHKVKVDMDSDDDSEADFKAGGPPSHGGHARRDSGKGFSFKGRSYGKGDAYKGADKGYHVKEELGEDRQRRLDWDAQERAWPDRQRDAYYGSW